MAKVNLYTFAVHRYVVCVCCIYVHLYCMCDFIIIIEFKMPSINAFRKVQISKRMLIYKHNICVREWVLSVCVYVCILHAVCSVYYVFTSVNDTEIAAAHTHRY